MAAIICEIGKTAEDFYHGLHEVAESSQLEWEIGFLFVKIIAYKAG
jgi:hypothetical protein